MDEKVLRRRKAMVTGIVILTAMVLLGFIVGSWNYVNRIGNFLEDELKIPITIVSVGPDRKQTIFRS